MIVLSDSSVRIVLSAAKESGTIVRANEADKMPYSLEIAEVGEEELILHKKEGAFEISQESDVVMRFRMASLPFQFESNRLRRIDRETIVWTLPKQIVAKEPRDQLRVTVPASSIIEGELAFSSGGGKMICVDVSHAGAKVLLTEETGDRIVSGMPGTVILVQGKTLAQLDVIVMWRVGNSLGLLFPSMRRIRPEEMAHPWLRMIHTCLLDSLASAPICLEKR